MRKVKTSEQGKRFAMALLGPARSGGSQIAPDEQHGSAHRCGSRRLGSGPQSSKQASANWRRRRGHRHGAGARRVGRWPRAPTSGRAAGQSRQKSRQPAGSGTGVRGTARAASASTTFGNGRGPSGRAGAGQPVQSSSDVGNGGQRAAGSGAGLGPVRRRLGTAAGRQAGQGDDSLEGSSVAATAVSGTRGKAKHWNSGRLFGNGRQKGGGGGETGAGGSGPRNGDQGNRSARRAGGSASGRVIAASHVDRWTCGGFLWNGGIWNAMGVRRWAPHRTPWDGGDF